MKRRGEEIQYMVFKVTKRNGEKVDYNLEKISIAIAGAFQDLGMEFDDYELLNQIDSTIKSELRLGAEVTVEDIQDIIEDVLLDCDYYREPAKAYVRYRHEHELSRQQHNDAEVLSMIGGADGYWKTENSNKNSELVTVQRDYLAGILSTDIARNYIFPKEVIAAHDAGTVHQHDMDYMAQSTLSNCELINLNDMLQNGTVINKVKIEKPHKLLTAMTITTQIMASVAANTYGGESINLAHLAPFVRDSYNIYLKKYESLSLSEEDKVKLAQQDLQKEIEDAVQTFNYQISTLFTLNGQAPFCSLFMYLNDTEEYKQELILLIKEFLKQRIEGMPNQDGVKVTQAFPKILYVLQEDNYKPGTKYWNVTELAVRCSSCRLTPDYISEKKMKELKVNGNGEGDCYACMGCRSFLTPDETGNGFNNIAKAKDYDSKPKYWGRFNCGVVSINLPDIAFASGGNESDFWRILNERLEIAHLGLKTRVERLAQTKASVAPILWQHGAMARLDADETLDALVYNNYATASLGYCGGYEMTKIMTGCSQTEPEGKEFLMKVMRHLNNKCQEWKNVENIGYSVYGSPAESLCYKFAKKTRTRYPEAFEKFFGNKQYFENSYHIPSFEPIDPFTKIELEGEFQQLSPGGCLSYIESVDLSNNVQALYPVIEAIYHNCMYCEINIKTSYCHVCGERQTIDIHKREDGTTWWECDNCGNCDTKKMDVAARTCGLTKK
jgi:ribonucleoside-triphosphate reductase (formate)